MLRTPTIPRLAITLLAAGSLLLSAGCAEQVPPRPVPQFRPDPKLPTWYPMQPWNAAGKHERVFYGGKVVFDTAKATLRPASEAVLRQLLAWLQANPDISRVRLEGHTDSRASDEYNDKLSQRRSIAVANWLVDNGLDASRLLAVAFGESRPIATNDTAVGRQENRRASFHVAEVDGQRFEGKDPTHGGLVLTVLTKEEREAMKHVGEVPEYKPPPTKAERDIFKPVEKPKLQDLATPTGAKKEAPDAAATHAPAPTDAKGPDKNDL